MSFLQGQMVGVVDPGEFIARYTTFMENFNAVWDDDNLRFASQGVEAALDDMWEKNAAAYKAATGQDLHDNFIQRNAFLNKARTLQGAPPDQSDFSVQFSELLDEADEKLLTYQAAHPEDTSVQNFTQMWEALREQSKEFRDVAASVSERASIGGAVGGFTAGLMSSLNPVTNFWNFATLGIGGFGRGATQRIATEVGAGSTIEAIQQFTGVAERQELLGVPTTVEQKLAQIALAGAGAGVLRGAVEGAPALFRAGERVLAPQRALGREFIRVVDQGRFKNDPLADLNRAYDDAVLGFDPNLSSSAGGRALATAEQTSILFARADPFGDPDLHADKFLGTAEAPLLNLRDRLLGGTAQHQSTGVRFSPSDYDTSVTVRKTLAEANSDPHVIEYARSLDNRTINEYERLNKVIVTKRQWYKDLGGEARDARAARKLASTEEEIAVLEATLEGKSAKGRKTLQKKIDALRQEMELERARLRADETPDMKRIREEIEADDLRLRDMAPQVSALFKRAREKLGTMDPVTKPKIAPSLRGVISGLVERGELDPRFPVRSAMSIIDPRRVNGKRIEEVNDDLLRDLDEIDPKIEELHEAELRAITDTISEDGRTINLGREAGEVDLDATRIQTDEAGNTVSLREYLRGNELDDELLDGLTTCAIGGAT